MRILAAASIGVACALAAASLTGALPQFSRGRARRRGWHDRSQLWLQQAGVHLAPAQFWFGCAAAGFLVMVVLTALTGSPFVAVVPAVAVGLVPRAFFGHRRQERLRLVQRAWPDALRDLAASIAAGRSMTQAVCALAEHGPEPLAEAFARFPELSRVLGTGAALEIIGEDLADPTSDRVIEVLVLAHRRGGSLVREILDDLIEATTRDLQLLERLQSEGLEMRINSRVVVVLPWLVLVALTARNGPFRDFYRSSGGLVTLGAAAVMTVVGIVVLHRLGREESEPRVFGSRVRP